MSGHGRRRLLSALLAASALPAVAAARRFANPSEAPQMKTHAAGRHLIALPAGFEILEGSEATLYFGLDAEAPQVRLTLLATQASPAAWTARVQQRVRALGQARHQALSRPMLVLERAQPGGRAHLMRSHEDPQLTHVLRSEVFCLVGTAIAHLEAESYRVAPDEAEQRLLALATQLASPATESAPGPGLALGPLRLAADHVQEIANLNYRHTAHADLLFSLRIDAMAANAQPGLLQRWDRKLPLLARAMPGTPRTLRRGPLTLAGMAGEELLTQAKLDGRTVQKFSAESSRPRPSLATPLLTLALDTEPVGPPERWPAPAWGEDEAVQAWDAVARSLRPRPGAV
ncbi:T6SS immunity protein Tli4 family protein [Rubrivivax sp. A210]|uniref:T6SS immunity protein Tli4 family protein n=1 Tax=Rubrivivax sp. A210 TaxID=2772301 RepID=UPI001919D1DE|nr:T6SS immunity protein Tli4 family protein [Rubrivivax sp. A210]